MLRGSTVNTHFAIPVFAMPMTDLKIFSGNANPALSRHIADYLGVSLGAISLGSFPDGETSCKIDEDIRGRDVYLVQPTCPPANEHLMQLLVMIDNCKRASAERVAATSVQAGDVSLAEGQVEGGVAQGLGMALMEEYIPGRTENLHDYLIPTFGDMPEVTSIFIEKPDPEGPFGARGLGEHVLIPTAPAILNAIRHATGARITRVPALPHRVLAAIREART